MNFILKKEINKSLLESGFTLQVSAVPIISAYLSGGALAHGERRAIKIILDGEIFDATLTSVNFNREKYPRNKDMWQILYSAKNPILKKLAEIFARSIAANFKLPDSQREYFVLYATDTADIFCMEPIFNSEIATPVESLDEVFVEHLLEFDDTAALVEKFSLTKIRRLHREIGDYLKVLYNFRCQICGQNFKKIYGVEVAECHHIDYFVRSLNNDASNLLILCPNHHRIIHAANPTFDRKAKIFRYGNGFSEALILNRHL